MRRPVLLALIGVLAGALLRRRRAQRDESEMWTEAGVAPDLR